MKYNNNDIYERNWFNDKKDFEGKMNFHNGDIYNGNWEKFYYHYQIQNILYNNGYAFNKNHLKILHKLQLNNNFKFQETEK